jgi:hypothetical protein
MTTPNLTFSLSSICQQRKRQQLYEPPPVRLETISPYLQFPQFTKQQFDMRRKAEILKYSNNASSTKTNNLTRAERWAQLIRGKGQTSTYPQLSKYIQNASGGYDLYIQKITSVNCPNDDMIPTPTSSCDVPGPISYLVLDTNVPLYNSLINEYAYSEIQREDTSPWTTFLENDIQLESGQETDFMVLNIRNYINNTYYTYTIQVPIGIYFSASGENLPLSNRVYLPNNTIQLSSVDVGVYYNDALVTPLQPYQTSIVPSSATGPFVFDISFVPQNASDSFSFVVYSGILTIRNLSLYTQPGYIYDIKLKANVDFVASTAISDTGPTINYNTYFGNNTSYGIYCNFYKAQVYRNCNLHTPLPYSVPPIYPGFSFEGV